MVCKMMCAMQKATRFFVLREHNVAGVRLSYLNWISSIIFLIKYINYVKGWTYRSGLALITFDGLRNVRQKRAVFIKKLPLIPLFFGLYM